MDNGAAQFDRKEGKKGSVPEETLFFVASSDWEKEGGTGTRSSR